MSSSGLAAEVLDSGRTDKKGIPPITWQCMSMESELLNAFAMSMFVVLGGLSARRMMLTGLIDTPTWLNWIYTVATHSKNPRCLPLQLEGHVDSIKVAPEADNNGECITAVVTAIVPLGGPAASRSCGYVLTDDIWKPTTASGAHVYGARSISDQRHAALTCIMSLVSTFLGADTRSCQCDSACHTHLFVSDVTHRACPIQ